MASVGGQGDEWTAYPTVVITTPDAESMAEWHSILQDLRFTAAYCEKWLALEAQPKPDRITQQALWSASLVSYARAFDKDTRRRSLLESDIAGLDLAGDAIGFHRWARNLRNKHIAHPVNAFEETSVAAALMPESTGERRVNDVVAVSRIGLPEPQWPRLLRAMAQALQGFVEAKMSDSEQRVWETLEAMPIEDVYALPPFTITVPHPDDAGRSGRTRRRDPGT